MSKSPKLGLNSDRSLALDPRSFILQVEVFSARPNPLVKQVEDNSDATLAFMFVVSLSAWQMFWSQPTPEGNIWLFSC